MKLIIHTEQRKETRTLAGLLLLLLASNRGQLDFQFLPCFKVDRLLESDLDPAFGQH